MRNLSVLVLGCLLASCATQGPLIGETPTADAGLENRLARAAEQGEAGRALRDGVQALATGDSGLATKAFSRALKLDPDNPQLHLLNAISYHLGYSRGGHRNRDLAETGYLVALRMDPNNIVAAELLGQLYLDTGRFSDARRWIGKSLLLGESTARVYHSFAVASYYSQDLPLALWAITQAERLEGKSSPVLRAGALIRAATGQFEAAEERRRDYDAVEPDALLRRSLEQRVAQWRTALNALDPAARTRDSQRPGPELLAQAPPAAAPPAGPAAGGPLAPNWSDCAPAAQPSATYGGISGATGSADETVQLPALPSPCAGRPLPRMAVIDVAIIRSQDTSRTTKGINLLDSLSITFGPTLLDYKRNWTNDRFNPAQSANNRQVNRALSVVLNNVGGTTAGVTYSLNIANASDQANEVIARPSLLVLDRQPSTFFSGSTLTTTVPGQYGGSRVDHPVGVSLSVTPTFIDDDSMLLSVKAGRSFFQDGPLDLAATVQSTRNTASANVRIRFNETLVLSGLSEREIQESESGVPVLKEIPLLQYLFKSEQTLNFNHSILVLITPRRPETAGTGVQLGTADRESPEVQELRARAGKALKVTPNLEVVTASLDRPNLDSAGLFRQFRSGDLKAQVWHRPEGLRRILSEIASFLYY